MTLSPTLAGTRLLTDALHYPVSLDENSPVGAAITLHRAGLCVFPMPYGSKAPFKGMHYLVFRSTRLAEQDLERAFGEKYKNPTRSGVVNLAVMTGRQSGNLLVVDCETAELFGQMCNRVLAAGRPLYAANTARGGHVYLRCTDGEVAYLKGDNFEVKGNSGYVMAPPSVHPDGTIYTWKSREGSQPPALSIHDLREVLGLCLYLESYKRKGGGLSEVTQQFLAGRAPKGERNPHLYRAARELLGSGFDSEETRDLLTEAGRLCGLDLDKPRGQIDRTIRSAIKGHDRDDRKIVTRDRNAPRAWELATSWAKSRTWPGRTGATDRAIFLAHCARMRKDNPLATKRPSWRASQRELAELAQTRQETAAKATQRLVECGVLKRLPGEMHEANRYTLGSACTPSEDLPRPNGPALTLVNDTALTASGNSPAGWYITGSLYKSASSSDPLLYHQNDAFERGALPKTSGDLLAALSQADSPLTARQAGELCGLTKRQAKYALGKLRSSGLVTNCGDGWLLAVSSHDLPDELERVAYEAGTIGKGQKRKASHERSRQNYALDMILKARFPLEYKADKAQRKQKRSKKTQVRRERAGDALRRRLGERKAA